MCRTLYPAKGITHLHTITAKDIFQSLLIFYVFISKMYDFTNDVML